MPTFRAARPAIRASAAAGHETGHEGEVGDADHARSERLERCRNPAAPAGATASAPPISVVTTPTPVAIWVALCSSTIPRVPLAGNAAILAVTCPRRVMGCAHGGSRRHGLGLGPAHRRGSDQPPEGSALRKLLPVTMRYPGARLRIATGRRGQGRIDLEALTWPDTPLAREAEAEARGSLTPHILEHSYRTYVFGLVLAALDGAEVDEELCFVASMLHDLTLEHPTPGRCFAVVSGERAQSLALDHGWPADRAQAVGAAIAGHTTAGNDDLGDPAGFVSSGALLDVAGVRYDETDPRWMDAVLERHPRLELKRHLVACLKAESVAMPAGRFNWLRRYAGFGLLVRIAPFRSEPGRPSRGCRGRRPGRPAAAARRAHRRSA